MYFQTAIETELTRKDTKAAKQLKARADTYQGNHVEMNANVIKRLSAQYGAGKVESALMSILL